MSIGRKSSRNCMLRCGRGRMSRTWHGRKRSFERRAGKRLLLHRVKSHGQRRAGWLAEAWAVWEAGMSGSWPRSAAHGDNGRTEPRAEAENKVRLELQQGVESVAQGGECRRAVPLRNRHAGQARPRQVGHAADRQRVGQRRKSLDLQRADAGQASAQRPEAEELDRSAPDARPDHRLRRRRPMRATPRFKICRPAASG